MILRILLCLIFALSAFAEPQINVTKVWDAAPHNAFTDVARWKNSWWIVFREADAHVGGDGKIRVLNSITGDKWESVALIAEDGIDLRDPKLSITPVFTKAATSSSRGNPAYHFPPTAASGPHRSGFLQKATGSGESPGSTTKPTERPTKPARPMHPRAKPANGHSPFTAAKTESNGAKSGQ
jgi:hypothetical protein